MISYFTTVSPILFELGTFLVCGPSSKPEILVVNLPMPRTCVEMLRGDSDGHKRQESLPLTIIEHYAAKTPIAFPARLALSQGISRYILEMKAL